MNRAERREALIRLHAAKLMHARLLGLRVADKWKAPTRQSVHCLQIIINDRAKNVKPN